MKPRRLIAAMAILWLSAWTPAAIAATSGAPLYGAWGFDTSGMDRSVRPGDDFFTYANGAWAKDTAIPADRSGYGVDYVLADTAEKNVRGILESDPQSDLKSDPSGVAGPPGADAVKIHAAFVAFMGEERIEALGAAPIAADLADIRRAADRADLAYQALGSLARLYQVQGDAPGQYKAFSRLNAMQPSDRKIANNFAYYAALTDLGSQTKVGKIAEDNFTEEPDNAVYRSTFAFVLVWKGQAARALKLMEPLAGEWKKSPAVAFAYGAALAAVGRKPEAKEVFDSLSPRELSPPETEWIRRALR